VPSMNRRQGFALPLPKNWGEERGEGFLPMLAKQPRTVEPN